LVEPALRTAVRFDSIPLGQPQQSASFRPVAGDRESVCVLWLPELGSRSSLRPVPMPDFPSLRLPANPLSTKTALRVMDILDRWSARYDGHINQKRRFPRRELRTMIAVCLPDESAAPGRFTRSRSEADGSTFRAWTRNLSQSGLSFLHAQKITQTSLMVGLPMHGLATNSRSTVVWFEAEVIRQRQVHSGFWEYGVGFRQRTASPRKQAAEPGKSVASAREPAEMCELIEA